MYPYLLKKCVLQTAFIYTYSILIYGSPACVNVCIIVLSVLFSYHLFTTKNTSAIFAATYTNKHSQNDFSFHQWLGSALIVHGKKLDWYWLCKLSPLSFHKMPSKMDIMHAHKTLCTHSSPGENSLHWKEIQRSKQSFIRSPLGLRPTRHMTWERISMPFYTTSLTRRLAI